MSRIAGKNPNNTSLSHLWVFEENGPTCVLAAVPFIQFARSDYFRDVLDEFDNAWACSKTRTKSVGRFGVTSCAIRLEDFIAGGDLLEGPTALVTGEPRLRFKSPVSESAVDLAVWMCRSQLLIPAEPGRPGWVVDRRF